MSSIRFHPYSQSKPSNAGSNGGPSGNTGPKQHNQQQLPSLNKPSFKNANVENKKPIFHNQFNSNTSKKLDSNYEIQTYLNDQKPST